MQDALGHHAWGSYSAWFSLAFMLSPMVDMGLNQYLLRTLAAEAGQYKTVVGRVLGLRLALGGIYLPVLLVISLLLGYSGYAVVGVLVLGVAQIGLNLIVLTRSVLQARQRFGSDAFYSAIDKTLLMLLIVWLLMYTPTLTQYLLVVVISVWVSALIGMVIIRQLIGSFQIIFQQQELRQVLQSALPFAVMMLLFGANERVNLVLLERITGAEIAGLYTGGYRWIAAAAMYLWTITPIFYTRYAAAQISLKEKYRIFRISHYVIVSPLFIVCIILFFAGNKLTGLSKNSTLTEQAAMFTALKLLLPALVWNGIATTYSTWLTATDAVKPVNRLLSVTMIINLVAGGVAINFLSLHGGCYILVVNYAVQAVFFIWLFNRIAPIKVPVIELGISLLQILALHLLLIFSF